MLKGEILAREREVPQTKPLSSCSVAFVAFTLSRAVCFSSGGGTNERTEPVQQMSREMVEEEEQRSRVKRAKAETGWAWHHQTLVLFELELAKHLCLAGLTERSSDGIIDNSCYTRFTTIYLIRFRKRKLMISPGRTPEDICLTSPASPEQDCVRTLRRALIAPPSRRRPRYVPSQWDQRTQALQ